MSHPPQAELREWSWRTEGMILWSSCRYSLAHSAGMRVRDPLCPSSCSPDVNAGASSCCCLFGFLNSPQTSSQSLPPSSLVSLHSAPSSLPAFPASPPSPPQLLSTPGEAPGRGALPWQHSRASHLPAAPLCPHSLGGTAAPCPLQAAAELLRQAFVTRHLDGCHSADPESRSAGMLLHPPR